MDESQTNALSPNSQPCVVCCTPNLSPFTASRQVQVRPENHSGSCALRVQICETTVGDFHASKRTFRDNFVIELLCFVFAMEFNGVLHFFVFTKKFIWETE